MEGLFYCVPMETEREWEGGKREASLKRFQMCGSREHLQGRGLGMSYALAQCVTHSRTWSRFRPVQLPLPTHPPQGPAAPCAPRLQIPPFLRCHMQRLQDYKSQHSCILTCAGCWTTNPSSPAVLHAEAAGLQIPAFLHSHESLTFVRMRPTARV